MNNDYVQSGNVWIHLYNHDWRDAVAGFAKGWGNIPVVGWVTHGNLYVTLMLLVGAAEVVLRRWRSLSWHLPLLLLMGVMITAPANNSRSCSVSYACNSGASRAMRGWRSMRTWPASMRSAKCGRTNSGCVVVVLAVTLHRTYRSR